MTEKQEKVQQIYALIPKVMGEVGAIEKGRKNQQQGYTFRGIDDLFNAMHGPLSRHGVFLVPEVMERTVTERATQKGGVLFYTTVKAQFTFFAPDGSSVAATTYGEAMDSGDKSTNKAMSAALKYALLQLFCIPTEEQQDTEYQTHDLAPAPTRREIVNEDTGEVIDPEAPKATAQQVTEINDLMEKCNLPEGMVDKWFSKAGVKSWAEMPATVIAKCILYAQARIPASTAA